MNIFLQKIKSKRGFSLVESVLSCVVLAIIALTFASLFAYAIDSYEDLSARNESLDNARYSLNRISKELMYLQPSNIISISPSQLTFTDQTGTSTSFNTALSGGILNLYRGSDVLAQNLSSFSFAYYDATGALITDYSSPALLRRIQINISVKDTSGHNDVALTTEVYPRNFYYSNFQ